MMAGLGEGAGTSGLYRLRSLRSSGSIGMLGIEPAAADHRAAAKSLHNDHAASLSRIRIRSVEYLQQDSTMIVRTCPALWTCNVDR